MSVLTQERLKALLRYDPKTGAFFWLVRANSKVPEGTRAGSRYKGGYCLIKIDGRRYAASRLAVFYMTGEWPIADVDHRDGDPSNDRWRNIRPATTVQNLQNKRVQSNNRSGLKGVSQHGNRFRARIKVGPKQIHLGVFDSPKIAHQAYVAAAQTHFGEFARAG